MRIADIKYNDVVNGEGICVSVWFQGCPHRCPGCHNPETWDYDGGYEIDDDILIDKILSAIGENHVQRNLSLLGGEPLQKKNISFIVTLTTLAKHYYPNIKIFLWTGYEFEYHLTNILPKVCLDNIDYIIDNVFLQTQRDITLKWRGSSNQHIWYHEKNKNWNLIE